MKRYLMLLEVSQKQAYIFADRTLGENLKRSDQISYVTSDKYFSDRCSDLYKAENMVYSGGGHTVLQFESREQAAAFSKALTRQLIEDFPDMELFVKVKEYDDTLSPRENLTALSAALEEKKAARKASFRRMRFGIEAAEKAQPAYDVPHEPPAAPEGWELTENTEEIAGDDNFVAIVHIDGNGMGKRLQNVYAAGAESWEKCAKSLYNFSQEIKCHYAAAYDETARQLADAIESDEKYSGKKRILPMRRIIGAGDDVCFICAGSLGLECAAAFLKNLQNKINSIDGKGYTACAGVTLVHTKYPFRVAYDLCEELCNNAKKYGASLQDDGSVCVIDWHIEFGQLKDGLSAIRKDYIAQDGTYMTLRPLVVTGGEPPVERTYNFFTTLTKELSENRAQLARSKVKALRTAFAQGKIEAALAMRSTNTEKLLWSGVEKRFPNWLGGAVSGEMITRSAYASGADGKERCLYFDAIETMDHIKLWREARK